MKGKKRDEKTISKFKLKVWKVELEEEKSNFECYNKWDGKPVHVDVDRNFTGSSGKDPALALLSNKLKEDETNKEGQVGVGMMVGIVRVVSGDLIESLHHRSGWVVYHISESEN